MRICGELGQAPPSGIADQYPPAARPGEARAGAAGPLQSTLISSYTSAGPVIEINASDVENATGFNFAAAVISGITFDSTGNPDFTNSKTDVGPDPGHGFWKYKSTSASRTFSSKIR